LEAALRTATAAILISSLSFLGLGVPPPGPDWGAMVYDGASVLSVAPLATIAPALGIVLLVMAANIAAGALARAGR
jgi:peptide/nickel transport system permease protein